MPKRNLNKSFEVARLLEKAVLAGQLKPGTRLQENRLSQELDVSQSSIREALQDLESIGLVIKKANRGSYVIQLSSRDIAHIFQVRRELEPLACQLLVSQITQQTIQVLNACMNEMKAAAQLQNYILFQEATLQFHREIWAAQPNRYLERFLQSLCLPLFAFDKIQRFSTAYANYARTIRQHELLLLALQLTDADRAVRLMRHLVDRWLREDLQDYTVVEESPPPRNDDTRVSFAFLRMKDQPVTQPSPKS